MVRKTESMEFIYKIQKHIPAKLRSVTGAKIHKQKTDGFSRTTKNIYIFFF